MCDAVIMKECLRNSNNNETHFCLCGFNILRIDQQLSDCIDIIAKINNGKRLNPIVETCVCDNNED